MPRSSLDIRLGDREGRVLGKESPGRADSELGNGQVRGRFPFLPVPSEAISVLCGDGSGGTHPTLDAVTAGTQHRGSMCTNTAWGLLQQRHSEWVR